jgi:hypothetical protein
MLRDLAETPAYQRCCTELDPNIARLDESLRFALQAIAEAPESFPAVPKTQLRRAKTVRFPGAPAMIIYFHVTDDDSCCELLWIELAAEQSAGGGEEEILGEGEQSA